MSDPVICAAPHCDQPVVRRPGQLGRPPSYCSPACRPSSVRPSLTVEVDQRAGDLDDSSRDWEVRIRRGRRVVIVRADLGRFSATALATELRSILAGRDLGEAS